MTAANSKLASARLYLVSAGQLPAGRLADLIPDLARAGVDLVQLREKELEAGDLLRAAREVSDACTKARLPFVVNDRPDVAAVLGVGVHVGQNDLPVEHARGLVGDGIVGLSTHARAEIDAAVDAAAQPDYLAVGPVFETPTKPGRPGVGLELIRYASARITGLPWFAIGGIDADNLPQLIDAGARRIVVVRAITHARDPVTSASRLRSLLDEGAL